MKKELIIIFLSMMLIGIVSAQEFEEYKTVSGSTIKIHEDGNWEYSIIGWRDIFNRETGEFPPDYLDAIPYYLSGRASAPSSDFYGICQERRTDECRIYICAQSTRDRHGGLCAISRKKLIECDAELYDDCSNVAEKITSGVTTVYNTKVEYTSDMDIVFCKEQLERISYKYYRDIRRIELVKAHKPITLNRPDKEVLIGDYCDIDTIVTTLTWYDLISRDIGFNNPNFESVAKSVELKIRDEMKQDGPQTQDVLSEGGSTKSAIRAKKFEIFYGVKIENEFDEDIVTCIDLLETIPRKYYKGIRTIRFDFAQSGTIGHYSDSRILSFKPNCNDAQMGENIIRGMVHELALTNRIPDGELDSYEARLFTQLEGEVKEEMELIHKSNKPPTKIYTKPHTKIYINPESTPSEYGDFKSMSFLEQIFGWFKSVF